jgi:hypothetical protein
MVEYLTEVQTEHVHALTDELINGLGVVPSVFLAVDSRNDLLAELSARLVDAEPFQLACALLLSGCGESCADQGGRGEEILEKHGDCCLRRRGMFDWRASPMPEETFFLIRYLLCKSRTLLSSPTDRCIRPGAGMERKGPSPSSQSAACSIVTPAYKSAAWNKVLEHINGLLV